MRKKEPKEVFETMLSKSQQNLLTGCREWHGIVNRKGYGSIRWNTKWEKTHRAMWEYHNGPIPKGMHVLHACDNPSCIEIVHLFLGTNKDNIDDKLKKDRSGKNLSIAKVREVKKMISHGISQTDIANFFGINQSSVSRIASGLRWSHIQAVEG